MDFGTAVKTCLNKYATFSGRAARSEFWYFALFTFIANVVASVLDSAVFNDMPVFSLIATIVFIVPSLAVGARRLHDKDLSGWWQLLSLTVIGAVVLLVWYCQRGTVGQNRFGTDPLQASAAGAGFVRA